MRLASNLRARAPAIAPVLFITFLSGAVLASPGHAGVFTDIAAFTSAVNAGGIAPTTDDFSAASLGNISPGGTVGSFRYSFDPSQTQPAIVANQTFAGNALGGASFGVFVAGDSVTLTFTGATPLRAFGMDISAAPSFGTTLPAGIYQQTLLDGNAASTIVGNLDTLSTTATDFFLGFVEDPADSFTKINLSVLPAADPSFLVPAIQVNDLVFGAAVAASTVPEPGSLGLLAGGLALLAPLIRRRVRH